MKNEFEIRLAVIKHMARMMVEMSDVDFDNLSKEQEEAMLEDYEDVALHLLDSLSFSPQKSEDGVSFTADFVIQEPEKYIKEFLSNEG